MEWWVSCFSPALLYQQQREDINGSQSHIKSTYQIPHFFKLWVCRYSIPLDSVKNFLLFCPLYLIEQRKKKRIIISLKATNALGTENINDAWMGALLETSIVYPTNSQILDKSQSLLYRLLKPTRYKELTSADFCHFQEKIFG